MNTYFEKLNTLRSQKETGLEFNFTGAIYTIIPSGCENPRYIHPLGSKTALKNLIAALMEAKDQDSVVIAAWVGQYKTDMFLIDDIDMVIQQLSNRL